MPSYNLRILLETIEGEKTSYITKGGTVASFVNTATDGFAISSSIAYGRITGSVSCSFQNQTKFTGDTDATKTFKQNTILSASLSGSTATGSIVFTCRAYTSPLNVPPKKSPLITIANNFLLNNVFIFYLYSFNV